MRRMEGARTREGRSVKQKCPVDISVASGRGSLKEAPERLQLCAAQREPLIAANKIVVIYLLLAKKSIHRDYSYNFDPKTPSFCQKHSKWSLKSLV